MFIDTTWKEFQSILPRMDRVWSQQDQEGRTINWAAKNNMLGKVKYIFIRSDGWMIGATKDGYKDCLELWEDQWDYVYELDE